MAIDHTRDQHDGGEDATQQIDLERIKAKDVRFSGFRGASQTQ